MEESKKTRHGIILGIISFIILISAAINLYAAVSTYGQAPEAYLHSMALMVVPSTDLPADTLSMYVEAERYLNIIETILQVVAAVFGLRAAFGKGRASACEVMGILLIGAALLATLTVGFIAGFDETIVLLLFVYLFVPVVYYLAAHHEAKTAFWRSIELERSRTVEDFSDVRYGQNIPKLFEQGQAFQPPSAYIWKDGYLVAATGENQESDTAVLISTLDADWVAGDTHDVSVSEHADLRMSNVIIEGNSFVGSLAVPKETLPAWLEMLAGPEDAEEDDYMMLCFRCDNECLELAGTDDRLRYYFAEYASSQMMEKFTPTAVLCEFIGHIVQSDMILLGRWRDRLNHLEGSISNSATDVPADFDEYLALSRNRLYCLVRFYKQAKSISQRLARTLVGGLSEEDKKMFDALASYLGYLSDEADDVISYSMGVRELYKSKVEVRQGSVAQMLTIVATIFMTISAITSWYGMNFENMPELPGQYSYLVIIGICVILATVEIAIFKKKKWL